MKYYNTKGDIQYVLHCPGVFDPGGRRILINESQSAIKVSDKLSIIIPMNSYCKEKSYIDKQLTKSGIRYYNDIGHLGVSREDWNNLMKIDIIVKQLSIIKTEYTLILDGSDTIILNDLDDTFIDKFIETKSDILYNGEILVFPKPKFPFENGDGECKYLNSGVCVGKTDALLKFYKLAKKYAANKTNHKNVHVDHKPSEQYIIKKAVMDVDNLIIKIDDTRKLFSAVTDAYTEYEKQNDSITIKMNIEGVDEDGIIKDRRHSVGNWGHNITNIK